MATIDFEKSRLQPLTTDALLESRVADLIGRAIARKLWFLFLDDEQVQLPLLIPVEGLPLLPDSGLEIIAQRIEETMEEVGAHSVAAVIERYADAALTESDRGWANALHDAFAANGIRLRGILLSHRRGVRWLAQDDYRF
jgi:hypothetical protein